MVLNNKADSISEETREKVLRVVKEYNFKPYAKAIQNNSAHSGLVGLLIPGAARDFGDFISGAQEAAGAEGYSLILCSCPNNKETEKHLNSLFGKGVDGIAMYLPQEMDLETMFADAPEKLAYAAACNRGSVGRQCAVCCAFSDAAELAAQYLLDSRHRQIALLGWKQHPLEEELLAGYSAALHSREIAVRSEAVCFCTGAEDIISRVKQMICEDNTAFLCQDTQIAACVYKALGNYGLQIPKDYSVISVSDSTVPTDVFAPMLTVIDIRHKELGHTVMEALIAKIEEKNAPEFRQLAPLLRQGDSVAPPLKSRGRRILVVGSMNIDVMIHMSHIPTSGESLLSKRITNLPGGKGANQAVGAAKLGGDVCAIGCLGEDQEGRLLYNSLVENGVNTMGVQTIHNIPTGKAYILVAENGDSTIVFSHGTNGELTPSLIKKNAACFEDAQFCLLSTEIPWETVLFTIELCAQNGVKIILKPTTPEPIPPEVLKKIAFLVPNEKELEIQVSGAFSIEEKAARLFDGGAQNVIVTLGDKGCYLHNAEMKRFFPAADFMAVDTTGAGDAFISALAVYLCEGHSIVSSIKFATYAAGISVTRDGVQPAMAERVALEMYANRHHDTWSD